MGQPPDYRIQKQRERKRSKIRIHNHIVSTSKTLQTKAFGDTLILIIKVYSQRSCFGYMNND